MIKYDKRIFAKKLQHYMDQRGIDRNGLCRELELKYSTVSEWLNAKKCPHLDTIELLADYFGILKSDLIEDKPEQRLNDAELVQVAKELETEFNFNSNQVSKITSFIKFVGSEDDKE